jgi:hypothetical protein
VASSGPASPDNHEHRITNQSRFIARIIGPEPSPRELENPHGAGMAFPVVFRILG